MGSYETKHMVVRNEIKSQLARLLATEDLIVEHKKVKTASFDVSRRLLVLPMWERASDSVYDLLVGHEVGHALFTPDEDPPKGIPHQFINVTEDARIEKLIKRKYLGLAKTFFRGYRELNDDDFFQIADEEVDEMNLADRANLFFKVGNFVDISFTEEEQEIIDQIRDAETFADACAAAKVLYDYCKKPEEDRESPIPVPPQSNTTGQANNEAMDNESQDQEAEEEREEKTPEGSDTAADSEDEPTVDTMQSFEDNLQDLIDDESSFNNEYLEFPVLNLDTVIASNKEIHNEIDTSWEYQSKTKGPEIYKQADDELIRETALQLKRTIEAAVLSSHPEWAAGGMVGEEVQAFSDFLVYILESKTIVSDWAVVVFDKCSGFVDVYRGKNYQDEAAKDNSMQTSNTLTIQYVPGHYQPLVAACHNSQRPSLKQILSVLDESGVLYVVTDGNA